MVWFLQVPIDVSDMSCHDKIVLMASKNHDNGALASSPIDFVSAAGSVQAPKDLISGLKLNLKDFLIHYRVVRADNQTVRVGTSIFLSLVNRDISPVN